MWIHIENLHMHMDSIQTEIIVTFMQYISCVCGHTQDKLDTDLDTRIDIDNFVQYIYTIQG